MMRKGMPGEFGGEGRRSQRAGVRCGKGRKHGGMNSEPDPALKGLAPRGNAVLEAIR